MDEHEPPGYDDWFDEPEPPTLESGRGSRAAYDMPAEAEEDVWTLPEDAPRRSRRGARGDVVIGGRTLTTSQVAILAVLGLAVFIALLAAFGAFSSNTAATTASVPTHPTLPTTSTQATTSSVALPTTTLTPGSTDIAQVKRLQAALKSKGFYQGKIDGDYGPGTQGAVEQFQGANGLTPDGVVGPKTLAALRQQLSGG